MKRTNMRIERMKRNLSAREVAEKIGVHENALLRWESGQAEPLSTNLISLCELYGCSAEYLLQQIDDPNGRAVANS